MVENFMEMLKEWAEKESHVESVIIVGSYARGTNRDTSDVDVCILTANKAEMVEKPEFIKAFGSVEKWQTEYYGACTSIRAWYSDGKEVEFGLMEPSWIDIPLDPGTHRVLSDGYRVIVDKKQYFDGLEL